jgi:hypothetical protein
MQDDEYDDSPQDTSAFFGATPPAVKFDNHGDKVTGIVTRKMLRQQVDLDTGEALTWNDGTPRMQVDVTLSVQPKTDDDDGLRRLYVRGLMRSAIVEAVKTVGGKDLNIGDLLTVEYTSDNEPAKRGLSGAKVYAAEVAPRDSQAKRDWMAAMRGDGKDAAKDQHDK